MEEAAYKKKRKKGIVIFAILAVIWIGIFVKDSKPDKELAVLPEGNHRLIMEHFTRDSRRGLNYYPVDDAKTRIAHSEKARNEHH